MSDEGKSVPPGEPPKTESEPAPPAAAPKPPAAPPAPPAPPPPNPADEHAFTKRVKEKFPDAVVEGKLCRDDLFLTVKKDSLLDVCRFLRDDPALNFNYLSFIAGAHYPKRADAPLECVYGLYSVGKWHSVYLRVHTKEDEPIPSVTGVWPAANWNEREAYDLYGIRFEGHPGLKRILLPEWWDGYPMRKDYPMVGPDEDGVIDTVLKEAAGDGDFGPGAGSRGW
jgi:NADH-quinone oxidoreductase subunit C